MSVLKKVVGEDNLPDTLGKCLTGCFLFLDIRGAEPDPPRHSEGKYAPIERKLLRSGARPTVYYHVSRYDDTDQYAVQFWFLYLFNYRLNEHESDWEQITLQLDENSSRSPPSTRRTRAGTRGPGRRSSRSTGIPSTTPRSARTRTTTCPARIASRSCASA